MNRCAQFLVALAALTSAAAFAQSSSTFVGPTNTPPNPASQKPQVVVSIPMTTTTTTVTNGQSLQRKFPQNALRGKIVFGTPPAIELDDNAVQMAAGYRVHGYNNLLLMSAQLIGLKAVVNYTTDVQGQPREIWLLTDAETANKPWPRTTAEAAAWTFDPTAQTWTKP